MGGRGSFSLKDKFRAASPLLCSLQGYSQPNFLCGIICESGSGRHEALSVYGTGEKRGASSLWRFTGDEAAICDTAALSELAPPQTIQTVVTCFGLAGPVSLMWGPSRLCCGQILFSWDEILSSVTT